ncbi:HWE histidine kinase domain-containing protein [Aurantiacibacter spongiae]|uniref:histidine kinase n=1 Tax=Aurantiacibacter spongiae TaxID=2488860 RepID=A0A3N5CPY7_9SPHN|nr:HWE histidine kinase domain-containing protein [Aurantiacibacter spongiae]RPF71083.1 GAF domain-containing protein [Aurantiacibacter spongiae]
MNVETSYEVDLTSCDREPIHQLGLIQDFGALIAVTSDWNVAFKSRNCHEVLGLRKPVEIGDRLADHFSAAALESLRRHAGDAGKLGVVERLFGIDLDESGRPFDIAVHSTGPYNIIEIEPSDTGAGIEYTAALRPMVERLQHTTSAKDLCEEAATQLKRFLGFDRVMVYKFHPDESGEVIAEARESHLDTFLSLRYPKTDIPQQARRLYRTNLFRIISDVNAEPVPLEPRTALGGDPLDLSKSTLRAVSPIHIEYLQNMGVGASLSISIIVEGKLWGLFACHHYSARRLPFKQRTAAELFSQLFSLQLEIAIMAAGNAAKERARDLHDRLMSQLIGGSSLADNLEVIENALAKLIPHDGLSAYINGEYRSRGAAPNEEEFRALVPALNTSSTSSIVHSDALADLIPKAQAFAGRVVGALIIPVSRRPRDYVTLWRRELQQTVTWAGNPEKVATIGPNGDRLTPRKSFAAWQESVSGRSADWSQEELGIAERLRVTLLEVILRVTDEQVQERARAQERQELLIAELNHRVRNILTLIRSLIGQSKGEAKSIDQFADLIGGRIRALAMAHDHITRENWASASLVELLKSEAEAYLVGKANRVNITGEDALVNPEAYTVLALVVHEMMTNSAKYGSLCDSSGSLDIEISFTEHRDLAIAWREHGGPPVKAPTRRGFGSTIIEKSIPFELKGNADVRYKLSGLEADFVIPSRFAEAAPDEQPATQGQAEAEAERVAAEDFAEDETDRPVLVVEDSMIIAMDAEEMLRQIGFSNVVVASSTETALAEIAKKEPILALLDFNLGDGTSEAIARKLTERSVPFWFVTGYGDAVQQLSKSEARGVLQKPYTRDDLQRLVSQLSQKRDGD